MPRPTASWTIAVDYDLLQALTGKKKNALEADRSRGRFKPDDLESLLVYIARNGTFSLRMRLVKAALSKDLPAE